MKSNLATTFGRPPVAKKVVLHPVYTQVSCVNRSALKGIKHPETTQMLKADQSEIVVIEAPLKAGLCGVAQCLGVIVVDQQKLVAGVVHLLSEATLSFAMDIALELMDSSGKDLLICLSGLLPPNASTNFFWGLPGSWDRIILGGQEIVMRTSRQQCQALSVAQQFGRVVYNALGERQDLEVDLLSRQVLHSRNQVVVNF